MVVIVGGMIGIGKTTTSKMLGKETGLKQGIEGLKSNKPVFVPMFLRSLGTSMILTFLISFIILLNINMSTHNAILMYLTYLK